MACEECRRRAGVLELLSPFIEKSRAERNTLRDVLALSDTALARAVGGKHGPRLAAQVAAIAIPEGQATCRHVPGFPQRLLDDPTIAALFVAGDPARLASLTDEFPAVAIVGTRRASPEGMRIAREMARTLAAAGVTVVSGMALGIDSSAHEGALEGGGATVAVLACGPDVAYPRSKLDLHRRLVSEAAVVSELPPQASPRKWGFPARNRIIAALAQATIVIEAANRSGSLITAEFAMDLGRDVLAVPGSVRSWRSDGTNALIRDGAALIRDGQDVLDSLLGPEMAARRPLQRFVEPPPDLAPAEAVLLQRIGSGGARLEDLVASLAVPNEALAALAGLELMGLVRRLPEGGYERVEV